MAATASVLDNSPAFQLAIWGYALTGAYRSLDAAWERGHADHPELWDRTRAELNTCVIRDQDGERNPPDWWALCGAWRWINRRDD